jgi:diguanylate cyclase (GGDEF)-like protein
VANRVRDRIGSSSISIGGKTISVTVSVGVATFRPDDRELDGLLSRADEALLTAKSQGRDRCVIHPSDIVNLASA